MNYATSVEQSKHLLEIGLDPYIADNCYIGHLLSPQSYSLKLGLWMDFWESQGQSKTPDESHLLPAWSLGTLLDLIPKHLDSTNVQFTYQHAINLHGTLLEPELMEADGDREGWGNLSMVAFTERWAMFYDGQMPGVEAQGSRIVDAAVKMIDWLVANNIPLNPIQP